MNPLTESKYPDGLPLSRQHIAEIKADLDAGRTPQIIWLGVYPKEAIMATMIFYELEDEYNMGRLTWAQFANGVSGVAREFLGEGERTC